MWQILLMVWTNTPQISQVCAELPRQCLHLQLLEHTYYTRSIIHNRQAQNEKEIYGSFDYYQYPHDSNLTMTVLLEVLVRWSEKFDLPPILYLQFDNCVGENMNRYMFALLALLVEEKSFEKVCYLG